MPEFSILTAITFGVVGILISMAIFALPLYFFFSFSLLQALFLGVILSATDPLAVGALLSGNDDIPDVSKTPHRRRVHS